MAIDADGTRYILSSDSATLFVVRPHLGGVSGVKSRGFGPSSLNRSITSSLPTFPRRP